MTHLYRTTALFLLAVLAALTLSALLLAHALPSTAPQVGQVNLPPEVWFIASAVIGWLVNQISSPLTALAKRYLHIEGNVTRFVYVALSLIFAAGYGLSTGVFGQGPDAWKSALVAFVMALVQGLGGYDRTKQAVSAVLKEQRPTTAIQPLFTAGALPDMQDFITEVLRVFGQAQGVFSDPQFLNRLLVEGINVATAATDEERRARIQIAVARLRREFK